GALPQHAASSEQPRDPERDEQPRIVQPIRQVEAGGYGEAAADRDADLVQPATRRAKRSERVARSVLAEPRPPVRAVDDQADVARRERVEPEQLERHGAEVVLPRDGRVPIALDRAALQRPEDARRREPEHGPVDAEVTLEREFAGVEAAGEAHVERVREEAAAQERRGAPDELGLGADEIVVAAEEAGVGGFEAEAEPALARDRAGQAAGRVADGERRAEAPHRPLPDLRVRPLPLLVAERLDRLH